MKNSKYFIFDKNNKKMVKVKIVNIDDTSSTYDVTYQKAYVEKVMSEDNKKGERRKIKEIFVDESIVAKLVSNELVYAWNINPNIKSVLTAKNLKTLIKDAKTKKASEIKEVVKTVEIPSSKFWVSTATNGSTIISYTIKA
mgnify:CR=1 FL=1|tara:strand:- start:2625 stop:3047 length:423 start_codon:yes stop_codon:yes gene_type:complete